MTALDYLKSKERNVELGRKDSTRSWQPNITITLADNTVYPFNGLVDFAEPQVRPPYRYILRSCRDAQPERVLLPGQIYQSKTSLGRKEENARCRSI